MRALPAGLQDHLDTGVTTLCRCWRLTTMAGEALGFTDHDRNLSFDGIVYAAEQGFTASEMESARACRRQPRCGRRAVLRPLERGALAGGRLRQCRGRTLAGQLAGRGAAAAAAQGHLGEVRFGTLGFTAELRGLSHVLNQEKGRVFRHGCDAVLGDTRCGVDLANYSTEAQVLWAEERRRIGVSGAELRDDGWFARGTAVFSSGANAGRLAEIRLHRVTSGSVIVEFWQPMAFEIAAGDTLTLRAGCDRQFATCRTKFGNGLNFRGFPHMPGDDFALSYATQGDPDNTGGSLQS